MSPLGPVMLRANAYGSPAAAPSCPASTTLSDSCRYDHPEEETKSVREQPVL